MPYFQCENIRIAGIACAVPDQLVSVDSFKPKFGEEGIEKFKAMTGIQAFRRTYEKQTASDLGYAAAERLLAVKSVNRQEIGALVFVSHSPDYRRPATACVLHKRLSLPKECAAFDVNLGCSAYPYGLFTLASMMETGDISKALLICAETVSKLANPHDRTTATLFGDCGSATLLVKGAGGGINGLVRTDGTGYRAIIAPAGGFRNRHASAELMRWADGNERTLYDLHMDGGAVFNFTITDVPRLIGDFLTRTGTAVDAYDGVILHQANLFILKQIARKLKIPAEKMPLTLDRYGNTSGAAIPLTLCDAYSGRNDAAALRVLMCGFGVGLSLGVASAFVDPADLLPVTVTADHFSEGIINSPSDLGGAS